MIRRLLLAACASALLAGPAFAEQAQQRPAATDGVTIGNRLAEVGTVRPVGEDIELTVREIGDHVGAESFKAWRELADVIADAAAFMHQRRVVIVAHAPLTAKDPTRGLLIAQQRAQALREALQARGVAPDRILTTARPPMGRGVGAVDFVVTFEHRELKVSAVVEGSSQGRVADLGR